jgi:hypothetical protein
MANIILANSIKELVATGNTYVGYMSGNDIFELVNMCDFRTHVSDGMVINDDYVEPVEVIENGDTRCKVCGRFTVYDDDINTGFAVSEMSLHCDYIGTCCCLCTHGMDEAERCGACTECVKINK